MSFVDELLSRHRQLVVDVEQDSAKAHNILNGVAKKRRAMEALEDLIAMEGGKLPGQTVVAPFPAVPRSGTPISNAAYRVLDGLRKPMHYQELAELVQRQVAIGGQNPANTLLAHLSRDDRFYRPHRGTYALREWDPKARSVGVRRKKGA